MSGVETRPSVRDDHGPTGEAHDENARSILRFISTAEFSFQTAMHRLALLRLPDMPPDIGSKERLAFLHSYLDRDQDLAVRALGGLVGFLLKQSVAGVSGKGEI
mmetsp:Transcript_9198/g.18722  ORF Transcript_9198/g.18722 Transcript_9198/m.18722 type:complete len:104 (-) Transcript_9198:2800-3111(-)